MAEWTVGGTALTALMDVERRHGMPFNFHVIKFLYEHFLENFVSLQITRVSDVGWANSPNPKGFAVGRSFVIVFSFKTRFVLQVSSSL